VPQNTASRTATHVLHLFTCGRFTERSKTLPNIILGLMELNGWNFFEIIFTTSVPLNRAFGPETQVSRQFTFLRIPKYSKHSQTSLLVWGIRTNAFSGKWFSQFWYLEIVLSLPKQKFLSFYITKVSKLHENNPNHYFLCNGVEWMHMVWNHSHNFGTPKYCIQDRNTSFASFRMWKVYKVLQNTRKHNFGSNGVEWMDLL
jgi:hypothetical protein